MQTASGVITQEITHSSLKRFSLIPFKCDAVLNIQLSTLRTIRAESNSVVGTQSHPLQGDLGLFIHVTALYVYSVPINIPTLGRPNSLFYCYNHLKEWFLIRDTQTLCYSHDYIWHLHKIFSS